MKRATVLMGLILMGLPVSLLANTRLGLHVTSDELTIWRSRAASGPYRASNDVSTNSPGDWTAIGGRKESFRGSPGNGHWTGQTSGSCSTTLGAMQAIAPMNNNRNYGDPIRDAAFFALVLPNDSTTADAINKVRTELLSQAAEVGTDFSNTSRWCYIPGAVSGDGNPIFDINLWLTKYFYAYDYLRAAEVANSITIFTAPQKTTLDTWFRNGAVFWEQMHHYPTGNRFPNRVSQYPTSVANGTNYPTVAGSYSTCPPGGSWGPGLAMYIGSPLVYDFHEGWSNRSATIQRFVAAVGIDQELRGISVSTAQFLKTSAKRWFKEAIVYAMWPTGHYNEYMRWDGVPDEDQGWGYAGISAGALGSIADMFARVGETDLYTFSTSGGLCTNAGGPKTLNLLLQTHAQYVDHTITGNMGHTTAIDTAHRIDTISTQFGCARNYETMWLQTNNWYQSTYRKNIYMRQPAGGPINPPAYPSNICNFGGNSWGGDWGQLPGALFMFGNMADGLHPILDVYTLTGGGPETIPAAPTNLRVVSP